ncbi:hypothetical protein Q1695_004856 [Nippostrongylus brasiliensis]|nr:hypothetical protein Q1695_004856 [Nippostrongylus brasiliensis]
MSIEHLDHDRGDDPPLNPAGIGAECSGAVFSIGNMLDMNGRYLYQVLGLSKTATTDEIERKFRDLEIKYRMAKDLGTDIERSRMLKEIEQAHRVLSDPEKRKVYDRCGIAQYLYRTACDENSSPEVVSCMECITSPSAMWSFLACGLLTGGFCGCCCCCCFCCCDCFCNGFCGRLCPRRRGRRRLGRELHFITSQPRPNDDNLRSMVRTDFTQEAGGSSVEGRVTSAPSDEDSKTAPEVEETSTAPVVETGSNPAGNSSTSEIPTSDSKPESETSQKGGKEDGKL